MYKDSHVHTNISHDGVSTMQEYIEFASSKNVDEITFCEHFDIYDGIITKLKTISLDKYFEAYIKVKKKYCRFKINFGIELGLQPDIYCKINELVGKYPFDFIIGSSHITCKKDIGKDNTFFTGLSRKKAYIKYFEEVLKNIQIYDDFDVYGHLDYIVRYGNYKNKKIDYDEFGNILDEILKHLIKKGKGIEINTAGFRYGMDSTHPNREIVKRFKELGGNIITLGSDAHNVDQLGKDFDKAIEMLKSLEINKIAFFRKRKPIFINI